MTTWVPHAVEAAMSITARTLEGSMGAARRSFLLPDSSLAGRTDGRDDPVVGAHQHQPAAESPAMPSAASGTDGGQDSEITDAERLDLLRFHITRQDGLRASIQNRASVLLSAGAVVLAATSVLYAQDIRGVFHSNRPLLAVVTTLLIGILLLTIGSIWNALSAMISVRSSRDLLGDYPSRGIYAPSDVVRTFATYREFHDGLVDYRIADDVRSAEVQFWADLQIYMRRYRHLRRGVALLFGATSLLLSVTSSVLVAATHWP